MFRTGMFVSFFPKVILVLLIKQLAFQKNNHISKGYKIAVKTNNKTFTRFIKFARQIA